MANIFNNPSAGSGTTNIASGIMGLINNPYSSANNQLKKYAQAGSAYQMPFYNAGVNALDPYQQNLQKMSDPVGFYNTIMGGYSESPYAQYEQQQAMNAANNMASATGLTGSTPLMMQEQQTASDISSKDMDKYFQDVYGINSDYMKGLLNLITGGQHSADELTQMMEQMMRLSSGAAFGQAAMKGKSEGNLISGLTEDIFSLF